MPISSAASQIHNSSCSLQNAQRSSQRINFPAAWFDFLSAGAVAEGTAGEERRLGGSREQCTN